MSKDEIGRGNSIKIMLGGFVAGLALVRGYRPENPHYLDSRVKSSDKPVWYGTPREIVPILDMPLRFDPDVLRDKEHLLPPKYSQKFESRRSLGGRWIKVDNSDPWHEMRKRKLKLSHETAVFNSHTIPGYLPDINNDQDLMVLGGIEDATQRFEQMLIMMGIETQELNDPEYTITNPNIDPNIRYCASKLVEYMGIESRALAFDRQLYEYFQNEAPLSEEIAIKIGMKREEVRALYRDVSESFTRPMKNEYLLRVTRPYYYPSLDVWEYSRWEGMHDVAINNFPIIESDVRTRTLALVMHAHACIAGKSEESPLISDETGLAMLKPIDLSLKPQMNATMEARRLLEFVSSSQHLGYEEVTGLSFEEMMNYCDKGYYLLNFHYDGDPTNPLEDVELLWQNREAQGKTLWAVSSSSPEYSFIYRPVNLQTNQRIIGLPESEDDVLPKLRQFAHKM